MAILNYALTLEYLEAAFYTEADADRRAHRRAGALRAVVGAHERAHVAALQEALGSAAVKQPTFDFRGTTEDAATFRDRAVALEDTGVAAYKGQAPLIASNAVLAAALAIHTVEARHAAWIRDIERRPAGAAAFDKPLTLKAGARASSPRPLHRGGACDVREQSAAAYTG